MSVRSQQSPSKLTWWRDGADEPLVTQHTAPDRRPFLHPLVAPDGRGVLTLDAPADHAWQHGLYIGLNDVNGAGFWTEGLLPHHHAIDGTFHPEPIQLTGPTAWRVVTEYRSIRGEPLLRETQDWTLRDAGATYRLDLVWTLQALVDVKFGKYAYGGLFLRMPTAPKDPTARILNSEGGDTTDACEQKRARWIAVWMPLTGRADPAGVALFDHPGNPEHPLPWRADGYYGIGPSRSSVGEWSLANGAAVTFRHGVWAFTGNGDAARIEAAYQTYLGEQR